MGEEQVTSRELTEMGTLPEPPGTGYGSFSPATVARRPNVIWKMSWSRVPSDTLRGDAESPSPPRLLLLWNSATFFHLHQGGKQKPPPDLKCYLLGNTAPQHLPCGPQLSEGSPNGPRQTSCQQSGRATLVPELCPQTRSHGTLQAEQSQAAAGFASLGSSLGQRGKPSSFSGSRAHIPEAGNKRPTWAAGSRKQTHKTTKNKATGVLVHSGSGVQGQPQLQNSKLAWATGQPAWKKKK